MIGLMARLRVPLVLLTLVTGGCGGAAGSVERDGFVLERDAIDDDELLIRRRASFDLSCAESNLSLQVLAVHDDVGADMPTSIGVQGCGKRGTYQRQVAETWIPGTASSATTMGDWELEMVSESPADEGPAPRSGSAAEAAEGSSDEMARSSKSVGEAPLGVAGFEFKMNVGQAQAACERAGKQWASDAKSSACSGSVEPMGMNGTVQLLPCDAAFCQILFTSEPSEPKLVPMVLTLKEALDGRYGPPSKADTSVPRDCLNTIVSCVTEQRAYIYYVWAFENGQTIKLRLGIAPSDKKQPGAIDHKLRLLYTRRVPVAPEVSPAELAL
jgi:hypothetical protein